MDYCYKQMISRIDNYVGYGIAAVFDDGSIKEILETYSNLCDDCNKIAEFVDLCNKQELSLDHLADAVDDFLASL